MSAIILFDGVCNFCNASVQFIIKRDKNAYFLFGSLQSNEGKKLLKKHGVDSTLDSIVLIEGNKVYTESTAVLRIAKHLGLPWNLLSVGMIIPRPIRNWGYKVIATHRYQWFGRKESCMIPPVEWRRRFLEE